MTRKIHCSRTIKNILCEALENYAASNSNTDKYHIIKHPDLHGLIDNIDNQFNQNSECFCIDDNVQPHLEAAICYHYDNIHKTLRARIDQQKQLLLTAIDGVPVDDSGLDEALRKDNII